MSNDAQPQGYRPGDGVLALVLPEELFPRINAWRVRYDPAHMQIPPHVSIAYPPFVREPDWQAERPPLAELLAAFPAFDVNLHETGAFLAPDHVLWLKPDDGGMFARLESAVRNHFGLPPSPPPFEFTPHVTLAFFDTEASLRRAETEIAVDLAAAGPMRFRTERIIYLVMRGPGDWQVADELPLGTAT
jgi:2'-5' RNA ligase